MSPSPNLSSQMPNSSQSHPIQSSESAVDMSEDQPISAKQTSESPPSDQTAISENSSSEQQVNASSDETSLSHEDSSESEDQLLNGSSRLWHPIPPPSEPRQYRAIGLVRGRYTASQDQFTQGILLTTDGTVIDAVLLGRVMSLVKKHIDLEQEHLWVVYPRTRQKQDNLHVQIMGVWEPETLKKDDDAEDSSTPETTDSDQPSETAEATPVEPPTPTPVDPNALPEIEHGYFSIRGEVVYQSQDEEKYIIVKIRQSSRSDQEKPKFFKLKLDGFAGPKAVGHFWDLHVQLEQDNLVIQESHDIGMIPVKKGRKPFQRRGGGPPRGGGRGNFSRSSRPPGKPQTASAPSRSGPISKPVKPKPKTES
ncbi:hypothetical protein ACL6C3_00720 [Capilliphycus salinus ALCB114379]|uniref:hypothetical protein n=1 Tax=Capilliphycus salinus TaxID=2768948 RepID=UPI0039A5308B